MIVPNSKVLEFGAGHMALTKYLPKNCTYIPSDVVKRSPDTVICDLNAPKLPTLPVVDVVVLTGVFEYVNDIPRLISVFNSICHTVIASYAAAKKKGFGDICLRRSAGWVNDYTEEEFVTIFQNRGFILLERTMWREQIVCRFQRKSPSCSHMLIDKHSYISVVSGKVGSSRGNKARLLRG